MKIWVNYVLMNIGTSENKGVISKKKLSAMLCIHPIQLQKTGNVESY